MSKYNTNKNKYLAKSERASVPKITKKQKGSITIEAAFAIPLFLFAALCLIWMIEIQSIKIGVKQAAYSAAKSAALSPMQEATSQFRWESFGHKSIFPIWKLSKKYRLTHRSG